MIGKNFGHEKDDQSDEGIQGEAHGGFLGKRLSE
jgi:hypothetical protein